MPRKAVAHPLMTFTHDAHALRYPPKALVLVAGLPGAGKSTLLVRLYGMGGDEVAPVAAGDVRVIDSRQSRNWWAPRLRPVPPRLRTPLVHATHVWRIVRALLGGHPVVAHTRGTWPHILAGLGWLARRLGSDVYLILLDVPPQDALAGQRSRGRVVTARTFARHCRRWRALMAQAEDGKLTRAAGIVVLDRDSADRVKEIHFAGRP